MHQPKEAQETDNVLPLNKHFSSKVNCL